MPLDLQSPSGAFVRFTRTFSTFEACCILTHMITAEDIARELDVSAKTLRAWLRKNIPNHQHYERWQFSRAEADAIKVRYRAR